MYMLAENYVHPSHAKKYANYVHFSVCGKYKKRFLNLVGFCANDC